VSTFSVIGAHGEDEFGLLEPDAVASVQWILRLIGTRSLEDSSVQLGNLESFACARSVNRAEANILSRSANSRQMR
jgi:hypothetical protein